MRILVGPTEIGGIGKGLVSGLIELGQDARLVLSAKHPFLYDREKVGFLIYFWQLLGQLRAASTQSFFRSTLLTLMHRMWGVTVLIWAIFSFDAFIFLYGRTLTGTSIELIILRFFRKKIIFINMGSDIRPPYMDGAITGSKELEPTRIAKLAAVTKRRMLIHERYASFIVAQPSNSQFYERSFINWYSMGVPQAFEIQPQGEGGFNARLRILHSPSNSEVKGSDVICSTIRQLIDEGLPLELVRIEGVSNDQVLQCLQSCDFVVDQLYSDLPMAVLGSEAARFGKPCIVAGYLADNIASYISPHDIPPSLYVRPEQLREAIILLTHNPELRCELGLRANEFVSVRWSSKAVAERYLMLLHDNPQSDWWFDPSNIAYVEGCGQPSERTAKMVAVVVEKYGVEALQMSDKPKLEQELLRLANSADLVSAHA